MSSGPVPDPDPRPPDSLHAKSVRRAIVVTTLVLVGMCLLNYPLAAYWGEPQLQTAILLTLPCLGVVALLTRAGRVRAAGGMLIVISVTLVTIGATFGQGIHDYSAMAYPVVIFFSSLLENRRRAFASTSILVAAALAWLALGESLGYFHPKPPTPSAWPDAVLILALLVAGMIATQLVWHAHDQQLEEARRESEERLRAETALRESELRYRTLFEGAGDYVLVTELRDGGAPFIVDANEAAATAHGYSREELIGQPVSLLDAGLSAGVNAERAQALGAGQPLLFEAAHRRKDGSVFDVEVRANPLELGGRKRILAVERDITVRRLAEAALRESEGRLREAQEVANLGYWIHDHASGVVFWSATLYRLYGFDPAQPPPDWPRFRELIHPDDRAGVAERFEASLADAEGAWLGEYRISLPDGRVRHFRVRTRVDRDPVNGRWRTFGTDQDISDLRESEAHRQALANQLFQAQRLESLGRLAAGIAHDFNNILNIIVGNADLLDLDVAVGDDRSGPRLGAIRAASERGAALVRQLLTIARKQGTNRTAVDVNRLVLEFTSLVRETFSKTIEVCTELDGTLPAALADANELHQVLLNLSVNARDAMEHRGGTLSFTTVFAPGASVRGMWPEADADAYVQISVRDTGAGMDAATLAQIYDPFFTTKAVGGRGTGLGLSVVRSVVDAHAGFIGVTSERGVGTTFDVWIPAVERDVAPTLKPAATLADTPGGNETILVIEDEETARSLVTAMLAIKGYEAITADDGASGVEQFAAHRDSIALVLSDHGLPVFNGEEVYRRIRGVDARVPFVLMTGFIEPESSARFVAMGMAEVVGKPFSGAQLLTTIRRVLDSRA